MIRRLLQALVAWFLVATIGPAQEPETVRYLRLAGKSPVPECTFTLKRTGEGRFIRSVTERGCGKLEVSARYDKDDRLVSAEARLTGKQSAKVEVTVAGGKARVKR